MTPQQERVIEEKRELEAMRQRFEAFSSGGPPPPTADYLRLKQELFCAFKILDAQIDALIAGGKEER